MKIAYLGNFSLDFTTETHIARSLEYLGHEVVRLQENEVTLEQAVNAANSSDLFLWTRTPGFLKFDGHEMLRRIQVPTASYHLDLYVGIQRHGNIDTDAFWRTDYVFTPDGDPQAAEVFKEKGINHIYQKPGVYHAECYLAEKLPEYEHDVIFVGSYGYHPDWPYRPQLIDWLRETYGDRFRLYPECLNPEKTHIRGRELNQLYASAKVVVGDTFCPNFSKRGYWSDRAYETLGRGGFLIHPFIEGMDEEFVDGRHLAYYRYQDFNELKQKIDYYLEHPKERTEIKMNAMALIWGNCTYHHRLKRALEIIGGGQ